MLKEKKKCTKFIVVLVLFLAMAISITGPGVLPVLANESASAGQLLSLNQAITLALAHSNSVSKAEMEITRTQVLNDLAGSKLTFLPGHGVSSEVESAYSSALSANLNWQMSYKSLDQAKDALALSTCNQYWAVLQAQQSVTDAEAGVASSLKKLQIARVSRQVGLATDQTVLAAESSYQQALASLESAKNALDKAYATFNETIGLLASDRPALDPDVNYDPLVVYDLQHEISRVLENAPSIWKADQGLVIQQITHDVSIYSSSGNAKTAEAGQIALDQAQLDVSSAKTSMEQAVRSLYWATMDLEQAIASAQLGVKTAEETYRISQLKYDLGLITAADLAADAKTLSSARLSLFKLTCQHAYLKLEFAKPWAATS